METPSKVKTALLSRCLLSFLVQPATRQVKGSLISEGFFGGGEGEFEVSLMSDFFGGRGGWGKGSQMFCYWGGLKDLFLREAIKAITKYVRISFAR